VVAVVAVVVVNGISRSKKCISERNGISRSKKCISERNGISRSKKMY
jgi:hypothetical protein